MTFSTDIQMFDIPTSSTNGDVFKRVFPEAEITMPTDPTDEVTVDITGISSFLYFDLKWWNAPYFTKEREYER